MNLTAVIFLSIPIFISAFSGAASRRIWPNKKKMRMRIASYAYLFAILLISIFAIYAFEFWRPDVISHGWKYPGPLWECFYHVSYFLMFVSLGIFAAMEGLHYAIRIIIILVGYFIATLIYSFVNFAAFDL